MNPHIQSLGAGKTLRAEYCQQHRHRNIVFKMVRNKETSLFFSSSFFFFKEPSRSYTFFLIRLRHCTEIKMPHVGGKERKLDEIIPSLFLVPNCNTTVLLQQDDLAQYNTPSCLIFLLTMFVSLHG